MQLELMFVLIITLILINNSSSKRVKKRKHHTQVPMRFTIWEPTAPKTSEEPSTHSATDGNSDTSKMIYFAKTAETTTSTTMSSYLLMYMFLYFNMTGSSKTPSTHSMPDGIVDTSKVPPILLLILQ